MILRPPRSTRTDTLFPSRRSSDLLAGLGQLVPAELEHLVARHLRVIGREVARLLALEMVHAGLPVRRSEEHTSELQSLMRISYAIFCLKKKTKKKIKYEYLHNAKTPQNKTKSQMSKTRICT